MRVAKYIFILGKYSAAQFRNRMGKMKRYVPQPLDLEALEEFSVSVPLASSKLRIG